MLKFDMGLKDRIFNLVFVDRKKKRENELRSVEETRRKKHKLGREADAGEFDTRYFIRHRR